MRIKFSLLPITIIFLIMAFVSGCKKDSPKVIPSISTSTPTNITESTAISGGIISADGGASITSRGVCWGLNQNPTTSDNKTSDGSGVGSFTSSIVGLSSGGTYYVRAYATNSVGTAYGSEVSFRTNVLTVTDIEGNVYNTVVIGTQVWMKENLKTTKYRNGDPIGTTTPATLNIALESTQKYQWAYDGNENNVVTFGRLYTWYAATDSRSICPTGWHVPTSDEWAILTAFWGDENEAGGKLKEAGTTHWLSPNTGATNSSGFTALPGGYRWGDGPFKKFGDSGYWWSSTDLTYDTAWGRVMFCSENGANRSRTWKSVGHSVRCLKGEGVPTPAAFTATTKTIIVGQNVQFRDQSIPTPTSWSWSFGDGGTSTAQNPSHTYTSAGTYTVSLTATNSFGSYTKTKDGYIVVNSAGSTVKDIDGNIYHIVTLGTQDWLGENLKTTKYRNGDPIGTTTPATLNIAWESTQKYQWAYDGNENNIITFGRLYTWYAATDSRNVCPTGWHLPTSAEWKTLTTYLHSIPTNDGATKGLFYAFPGGGRLSSGRFYNFDINGFWWCSTEYTTLDAWIGYLDAFSGFVEGTYDDKTKGFSVRCIRD